MKYLILFIFLISGCIPVDRTGQSVCVSRCITIEGTILNSVTNQAIPNLIVKGSYIEGFLIALDQKKAESTTDVNGFYSMSFEVFESELSGDGKFELEIPKSEEVFWPFGTIELWSLHSPNLNFDTVYVADFLIPRPAVLKYDMDCLSNLKEDETATFDVSYSFEAIDGTLSRETSLEFNKDTEMDDGSLPMPAGTPLSIVARKQTSNGDVILKEMTVTLEQNQKFKVEVDI